MVPAFSSFSGLVATTAIVPATWPQKVNSLENADGLDVTVCSAFSVGEGTCGVPGSIEKQAKQVERGGASCASLVPLR